MAKVLASFIVKILCKIENVAAYNAYYKSIFHLIQAILNVHTTFKNVHTFKLS